MRHFLHKERTFTNLLLFFRREFVGNTPEPRAHLFRREACTGSIYEMTNERPGKRKHTFHHRSHLGAPKVHQRLDAKMVSCLQKLEQQVFICVYEVHVPHRHATLCR